MEMPVNTLFYSLSERFSEIYYKKKFRNVLKKKKKKKKGKLHWSRSGRVKEPVNVKHQ